MRPSDFLIEEPEPPDAIFGLGGLPHKRANEELLSELRRLPLADTSDVEAAVALARLLHDELQACGTGGGQVMDDDQIRVAIPALHAVTRRLGIDDFKIPFRDFSAFRDWWVANGAYGSWQARRDLLGGIFNNLHDRLADMEQAMWEASLADAISPHQRTGWSAVDTEIGELRRHFNSARTAQDYRAVGLDCVAVTEALSATVYDPARHYGRAKTSRRSRTRRRASNGSSTTPPSAPTTRRSGAWRERRSRWPSRSSTATRRPGAKPGSQPTPSSCSRTSFGASTSRSRRQAISAGRLRLMARRLPRPARLVRARLQP